MSTDEHCLRTPLYHHHEHTYLNHMALEGILGMMTNDADVAREVICTVEEMLLIGCGREVDVAELAPSYRCWSSSGGRYGHVATKRRHVDGLGSLSKG